MAFMENKVRYFVRCRQVNGTNDLCSLGCRWLEWVCSWLCRCVQRCEPAVCSLLWWLVFAAGGDRFHCYSSTPRTPLSGTFLQRKDVVNRCLEFVIRPEVTLWPYAVNLRLNSQELKLYGCCSTEIVKQTFDSLYCVCVSVCVCGGGGGVRVFLPCFVLRCLLIFVYFVRLYTIDLYNYGYLRIVYFSLSCKALWDSKSSISSLLLLLLLSLLLLELWCHLMTAAMCKAPTGPPPPHPHPAPHPSQLRAYTDEICLPSLSLQCLAIFTVCAHAACACRK